jgi:hypothetical protein
MKIDSKPVKSLFAPIKPSVTTTMASAPSTPPAPLVNGSSPPKDDGDILIPVEFWAEVVSQPEKLSPCWAFIGDWRRADFGRRVTVALNLAYWPATGAAARRDWTALRWLVSTAILERVFVANHPVLCAVSQQLCQLALRREQIQNWERISWSAYQLKDTPFIGAIEAVPLAVGTLQRFSELSVQVSAARLADWTARSSARRSPRLFKALQR